jgi:hypothetical protein
LDLPLNILGTVVPVHTDRIDWRSLFTTYRKKFHDSSEVVWLSGWLADEVGVIWSNGLVSIVEGVTRLI